MFEGKTAGSVFQNSDVLSNPVAGLMIGVLATFLFQSSSTTNGIAISLAVSKGMLIFHSYKHQEYLSQKC